MVYVTHDQLEASTFADKIAVMYGGQIVQFGTPRELFERPSRHLCRLFHRQPWDESDRSAGRGGRGAFAGTHLPLPEALQRRIAATDYTKLQVGIRPEFIHVWDEHNPDAMQANVTHLEDLGTYKIMTLDLDGATLKVRLAEDKPVPEGQASISFPRNG